MRRNPLLFSLPLVCLLSACGGGNSTGFSPSSQSASSSVSSGLSPQSSSPSSIPSGVETVNVIFEEDEHYTLPKYVYPVPKGGQLQVELTFVGKYTLAGLDYENATYEILPSGNAQVTLNDVRYSTRVHFDFAETDTAFVYHLNGGHFLQGKGDYYRLPATTLYHARPNLEMGIDRIARDGYTLLGWKDEAGEEIGLGSRYTIPDVKEVHFEAVWAKWEPASSFYYETDENYAYIKGYKGDGVREEIVVPGEIGGKPVRTIKAGSFTQNRIGKLVFPLSLYTIEDFAFIGCEVEHLYLYDGVHEVKDVSFDETHISHLHLLYSHPPRGMDDDPNTQFAEDLDRLIVRKDKKKIVFFAGCSGSYSINSKTLEKEFGDEYEICNMAVFGDTNATVMMESIIPYLGKDDLFIHAPEEMSEFQLLSNVESDNRLFSLMMGNYDIFKNANISIIPKFWNSFGEFVQLQDERDEGSFNQRPDFYYNEYGDYIIPRPNSPEDADFDIIGVFPTQFITATSGSRLDGYYSQVVERGAKCLFSFGPVNLNAVNRLDPNRVAMDSWRNALSLYVKVPTVISNVEDSILPGRYFFDEDYHCTDEGRDVRTGLLIRDLKAYLGR